MNLKKSIAILALATSISACQNGGDYGNLFSKENIGMATGAAGGAWVGSNVGKGKGQIVGIAAGTLLGGFLGKSIGASLDKADMNYYHQTSQSTLETAKTGTTSSWSNPDSGHSGTITPTRTYQDPSTGQNCREYTQTVNIGGKSEKAFGKACRQADGSWKIAQ
jgi:surface antigen